MMVMALMVVVVVNMEVVVKVEVAVVTVTKLYKKNIKIPLLIKKNPEGTYCHGDCEDG